MFCRGMGLGGTEKVVIQLCEMLSSRVEYLGVLSAGGDGERELDRLGVEHYTIPDISTKNPLEIIATCKVIRKIVKEKGINIIHCHHRMAALLAHVCQYHAIIIATAHNTFNDKKVLTKVAYHKVKVVACGDAVYKNLIDDFGINKENVEIIYNAVKEAPKEKINKNHKEIGKFQLGFIGRLSEQKGIDILIASAQLMKSRGFPFQLIIAGDGELKPFLLSEVEKHGLSDCVIYLGVTDRPQELLSSLDLCLMPSRWEGLPLVLLESFSVGTPVIATDIPGIREIVETGRNGVLIPAENPRALSDAVIQACSSEAKMCRLSQGAYNSYLSKYDYKTWERRYLNLYASCL